MAIFLDEQDYAFFLSLFKRHLSPEPQLNRLGREHKHLHNDVSLLSYCLMSNHFHLLLLNETEKGVERLMRSLATTYALYFNRKYSRTGPLFQSNFKASWIDTNEYIQHVSRYIHRNPRDYKLYPYSSFQAIFQQWNIEWLRIDKLLETFEGTIKEYAEFVADYNSAELTLGDSEARDIFADRL